MALNTTAPSYTSGQVVTAAELNALQDGIQAAWASYTPLMQAGGSNVTVGNGSWIGRYLQIGHTIYVRVQFTVGSSSSLGSGQVSVSLPVTPNGDPGQMLVGQTTGPIAQLTARIVSSAASPANQVIFYLPTATSSGTVSSLGLVSASTLMFSGTYEAA